MGAIEVRGLVREFKKGPRAVDGIDITVAEGEIYGFLGPNGAGKSTTVLMLTTLLPPTAGTATVAGFDIVRQGAEVRGAIGAALQEAALDKFLTGREHLKLQGALHGMGAASVGLIVHTAWRMARALKGSRRGVAVALGTLGVVAVAHWPVSAVVLTFGLGSVLLAWREVAVSRGASRG